MRGGGGQKMSVFVHAQSIKTVHGVKKWQNSVHVVVECPLSWLVSLNLKIDAWQVPLNSSRFTFPIIDPLLTFVKEYFSWGKICQPLTIPITPKYQSSCQHSLWMAPAPKNRDGKLDQTKMERNASLCNFKVTPYPGPSESLKYRGCNYYLVGIICHPWLR